MLERTPVPHANFVRRDGGSNTHRVSQTVAQLHPVVMRTEGARLHIDGDAADQKVSRLPLAEPSPAQCAKPRRLPRDTVATSRETWWRVDESLPFDRDISKDGWCAPQTSISTRSAQHQ